MFRHFEKLGFESALMPQIFFLVSLLMLASRSPTCKVDCQDTGMPGPKLGPKLTTELLHGFPVLGLKKMKKPQWSQNWKIIFFFGNLFVAEWFGT